MSSGETWDSSLRIFSDCPYRFFCGHPAHPPTPNTNVPQISVLVQVFVQGFGVRALHLPTHPTNPPKKQCTFKKPEPVQVWVQVFEVQALLPPTPEKFSKTCAFSASLLKKPVPPPPEIFSKPVLSRLPPREHFQKPVLQKPATFSACPPAWKTCTSAPPPPKNLHFKNLYFLKKPVLSLEVQILLQVFEVQLFEKSLGKAEKVQSNKKTWGGGLRKYIFFCFLRGVGTCASKICTNSCTVHVFFVVRFLWVGGWVEWVVWRISTSNTKHVPVQVFFFWNLVFFFCWGGGGYGGWGCYPPYRRIFNSRGKLKKIFNKWRNF